MRTRDARLPLSLAAVLAAAIAPAPAPAETTCYSTPSCGTTCTPPGPAAISTLVPASEFPDAADTPIAFADPADGSRRRLVATQEGMILVWDGGTQEILPTPFLDLRDDVGGPVTCCGERGLLALALDPEYAETGLLYVFYTRASEGTGTLGDIVVERYSRSRANPAVGDPESDTRILVIDHPASNHNGGWLAFGPDGFLYISTGDGGGGCDGNAGANGDGQVSTTLSGKLLRIDVRGVDPDATPPDDCSLLAGPYEIPTTNPFAGQEPACDEVWALGLRNPFRFSFDRVTGDLYLGDVGQDNWEEINLKRASTAAPVNFGWVCREGCSSASVNPSGCSVAGCPMDGGTSCQFPRAVSGFWDPILCHSNPNGWFSIMGGYRYRGANVPSLAGDYFYGDNVCGQIWKTDVLDPAAPESITASCWASGHGGTYGFAEDRLGELYIVRGGAGTIECIHNGDGCTWAGLGFIFGDGFESGDIGEWSP